MKNKPRWNAYCTTQKRTSINNGRRNTGTNQENPNKGTRSNKTVEEKNRQSWKENRIVYIDNKIYVPRNRQLQDEILSNNHNPPDIRYPGQHRIMELIKRNYQWSGIYNNV